MALSRAHASAKAQQSPLIQSTSIYNQTHSRITIIPQKRYTVTCGMTCPTYRNSNTNTDYQQNLTVSSEANVPPFYRIL